LQLLRKSLLKLRQAGANPAALATISKAASQHFNVPPLTIVVIFRRFYTVGNSPAAMAQDTGLPQRADTSPTASAPWPGLSSMPKTRARGLRIGCPTAGRLVLSQNGRFPNTEAVTVR